MNTQTKQSLRILWNGVASILIALGNPIFTFSYFFICVDDSMKEYAFLRETLLIPLTENTYLFTIIPGILYCTLLFWVTRFFLSLFCSKKQRDSYFRAHVGIASLIIAAPGWMFSYIYFIAGFELNVFTGNIVVSTVVIFLVQMIARSAFVRPLYTPCRNKK